jgi:protein-disulfide isomerase
MEVTMDKKKKPGISKSTKIMFWIIGVIFLCFIIVIFVSKNSHKNVDKVENQVSIDYTKQPFIGDMSAPVEIIEFGDYKCPLCKNFTESTFPYIKKELVDTGKAKFYFFNDSFINIDSTRSAKFAETVYHVLGNDAFWKFHDLLYKKQPKGAKYEKEDIYTNSFLEKTLNELVSESETAKVMEAFRGNQYDNALKTDIAYANQLGVPGTPTVIVNGKIFKGNTLDDLKKMVDKAAKGK